MKLGDQSQIPVERLAQLLLQRAREDDFLLRRRPANDDVPSGPAPSRVRRRPMPPADTTPHVTAHLAALEELVSVALLSAHEAKDVSWDVRRQARRGVAIALALGVAALAMAMAGTVVPCLGQAGERLAALIEAAPRYGAAASASLAAELASPAALRVIRTSVSGDAAANADRDRPVPIPATHPAA